MDIITLIILIVTGLLAGLLSGSMGVGGAIIVIPAMVFVLGLTQHEAQGTSLAFMIPPIGLFAAAQYWKHGYVNWKYALILALAFMLGAYIGSLISMHIPAKILKKAFGVFLLFVAVKMILSK